MKTILSRTAKHLGREFSEQAVEELFRLHARFATYSAMPAAALRLMRTMIGMRDATTAIQSDEVARAFAKQSGLPRFLVDDSIALDLGRVREALSRNVIGQQEPIELIVNLIATLKARLVRPGRPLASLMFIGPTVSANGDGQSHCTTAVQRHA